MGAAPLAGKDRSGATHQTDPRHDAKDAVQENYVKKAQRMYSSLKAADDKYHSV